jgi:hypothetical protein
MALACVRWERYEKQGGMTYEDILQNYYPHTVISTDWMPYEP